MCAGFSEVQARSLSKDAGFVSRLKGSYPEKLSNRINSLASYYRVGEQKMRIMIVRFPEFVWLDHKSAVEDVQRIYGLTADEAKNAIAKYSKFAGLDHEDSIAKVKEAYWLSTDEAKRLIPRYPQLADTDHTMVLKKMTAAFGCSMGIARRAIVDNPWFSVVNYNEKKEEVKNAYGIPAKEAVSIILADPHFVHHNHEALIKTVQSAYGCTRDKAILSLLHKPKFATRDHNRKVRQLTRLGRLFGIDEEGVKDYMLSNLSLSGFSLKRFLAVIDVGRHLKLDKDEAQRVLQQHVRGRLYQSPYVPGTEKLRISRAERLGLNIAEPPLMEAMRNCLRNPQEQIEARKKQAAVAKQRA